MNPRRRRRTNRAGLTVAAVVVMVAGACASSESVTLEGQTWTLQQLGRGTAAAPPEPTATFSGGRITGNGGCNSYTAAYAVDGSEIRVSGIMTTSSARCNPAAEEQQGTFFASLGGATGFVIRRSELRFSDPTGVETLVFSAGFTGR